MLRNFGGVALRAACLAQVVFGDAGTEFKNDAFEKVFDDSKRCIGIDLGTTHSCVAIYDPKTKSFDYLTYDSPARKTFPSTIYIEKYLNEKTRLPVYYVGYAADQKNAVEPAPGRYIYGCKRIIGIDSIDASSRLSNFKNEVTYPIRQKSIDGKGYYVIPVTVEGVEFEFTPTQIATILLGDIKSRLDELKINISNVCISTPAYFTTVQDEEVKLAAIEAKFPVPVITKEPVAACVTYVDGEDFKVDNEKKVLIFDFGGGTLDVTIGMVVKERSDETPGKLESAVIVEGFGGNNFLGGENVNTLICDEFAAVMAKAGFSTLSRDDMHRLRDFVENFKIRLCNKQREEGGNASLTDKFWFKDGTSIDLTLSNSRLNVILQPIYDLIRQVLFDKVEGLFHGKDDPKIREISNVVLVGGSTRIPYIKTMLQELWPGEGVIFDKIDADKAVALGACKISVSTDTTLGDSSIMVVGAVPLPIGIKLADGSMNVLVERNVSIPTESSKIFTTMYDNQTTILIDVAMGLRPMFDDNDKIGQVFLTLKNPKPKGVPQILVKIEYFADYSFKVTAEDMETKVSESAVFKSELGRPRPDKVRQMLEDAEKFKQADAETAKKIEELRLFEGALAQFEAQLNMVKSNAKIGLSELDKSYFETILDGSKKWLEENRGNASITAAVVQMKIEDIKNAAAELAQKVESAEKTAKLEAEKGEGREVL